MAFAADTFSGLAADADLGGRTASDGGTWTARDGAGSIEGNGADALRSNSSGGRAGYYHSGTPASADYAVSATVTITSTGKSSLGVAARMSTSTNSQYWAQWSGGNGWALYKRVGGSDTQLGGGYVNSDAPTSAKTVTLTVNGSTISVDVSGASNPVLSATDTSITAAGKGGVFNYFADVTSQTLDDFNAEELSTSVSVSAEFVDQDDSVAAAATLSVTAAAGVVDEDDSVASAATLSVTASAGVVDEDDSVASAAAVTVTAAADLVDQDDSVAAAAALTATAAADIVDEDDSIASSAALAVTAAAGVVDEDDSVASAAALTVTVAAALVDEDDSVVSEAAGAGASLIFTDEDDSAVAAATVAVAGTLEFTDESDTLVGLTTVAVVAALETTDADDTLTAAIGESEDAGAGNPWEVDFYAVLMASALPQWVGDEIYPVAAADAEPPYLVYARRETQGRFSLNANESDLERVVGTVSCYAETPDEAATIARAVIAAVPNTGWPIHKVGHASRDIGIDDDTRLFCRVVELSTFHRKE